MSKNGFRIGSPMCFILPLFACALLPTRVFAQNQAAADIVPDVSAETGEADTDEHPDGEIEDISLKDLLELSVSTSSLRAQPFVWAPNNSIVVTRRQIRTRGYRNLK